MRPCRHMVRRVERAIAPFATPGNEMINLFDRNCDAVPGRWCPHRANLSLIATLIAATLLPVHLLAGAQAAVAEGLVIHSFWVQEGPPGVDVLAGYFDIENNSDRPRRLVGLNCLDAGHVMIHQTEIKNGIAGMRAVEALEIPAHGQILLEPGGVHLMIMDLRRALRDGDEVPFELIFADGGRISATARVRKSVPPSDH